MLPVFQYVFAFAAFVGHRPITGNMSKKQGLSKQ